MRSDKEALRQKLRKDRMDMNRQEAAEKSKHIANKLLSLVDWATVKKLHIYSSVDAWNEVDTKHIIDNLRKNWPQIAITARPANNDEPFPDEQFDLIIVPVLGFDKDNYRLGLGSGWYDRFLAGQAQAQTIGLAYSSAKINDLPREPHDIRLDNIITEV